MSVDPRANRLRQPLVYGAVVAGAIFFVGWITGMGGSFWPNLGFSLAMGLLAAVCMWLIVTYVKPGGRGPAA